MILYKFDNQKPPKKPGVYFLYDKQKKLVYIGRSKNLFNRIRQHYHQTQDRYILQFDYCYDNNLVGVNLSYFSFVIIESEELRNKTEVELIQKMKPLWNCDNAIVTQTRVCYYFPIIVDAFKEAIK